MASLIISHSVFLTKEERYKIHENKEIKVVGVTTPVWFEKGTTSEPAKEIFCNYYLTNDPEQKVIVPLEDGYLINLPQNNEDTEIPNSKLLLNEEDGGIMNLMFKQVSLITYYDKEFNVVHFVDIKDKDVFLESLS